MQTVAQTIELVSYITATPRNRVNQLARALVTAGVFPKSVGRDVKKIDGGQMLGLIAAVAFAENVADAPAVASGFMALPLRADEIIDAQHQTLAQTIMKCMSFPYWEGAELELAIVGSGFTANMHGDVIVANQILTGTIPFWIDPSMGGWIKRSFVIDRSGIEILYNLFRRDDIDGVSFSTGKAE